MKKRTRVFTILLAFVMVLTCLTPLQTVSAKTTKKALNKTQATLYQKETVKLSVSGEKNIKWTSSNKKIASVNKKGVVTAKKAGKAKITAKAGTKKYVCTITVKKKPAVTKVEWISALLKKAGISTETITEYHFTDTKNNSAGKAIETAYNKGILPKSGKKFYPNRPATREFMAVTAVRAMGFEADSSETPSCTDAKKLAYAAEDQVALNQGFVSLKKKKFNPAKAITKAEKTKALRAVSNILKAEQVDGTHTNSVEYQNEVVESTLAKETDYTVSAQGDGILVSIAKDDATGSIKAGDVVVLPEKTGTQEQTAVKVRAVTENSDGTLSITGETPEISDVYQSINIQKEAYADMSEFVPNEDVVASVSTKQLKGGGISETVSVGSSKNIKLVETKLGSVGTFTGNVTLSAPKLTVIVDADFSDKENPNIKQISAIVEQDVTAAVELKFSSKGKGSGELCLGHLTHHFGNGLAVDVVCYLEVSADGTGTVKYQLSNTAGMTYINGNLRLVGDSVGNWDGMNAQVTAQVLAEPQINLRLFGLWIRNELCGEIPVIGVKADIGPKLKATLTTHETKPLICANVELYVYLSVGLNTDSGLGKLLKKHTKLQLTKVILDNNDANSFRATWHYEDGERTEGDVCTWEQSQETSAEPIEMIKLREGEAQKVQLDGTEETIEYTVSRTENKEEDEDVKGNYQYQFNDTFKLMIDGNCVYKAELSNLIDWAVDEYGEYQVRDGEFEQVGITDIDTSDGAKDIFIYLHTTEESYLYRLQYKDGKIIQKEDVVKSLNAITAPKQMAFMVDGYWWEGGIYNNYVTVRETINPTYVNGEWTYSGDAEQETVDLLTTTGDGTAQWLICIGEDAVGCIHGRVKLKLQNGKLKLASKNVTGEILETGISGAVNKKMIVYTVAGGSKTAFVAKKGEAVQLISYTFKNNTLYIKVKNKAGKTGWIGKKQYGSFYYDGTLHA